IHCPTPNTLPSNFYQLKRLMKECNQVTVYHYCSECYTPLTKAMKCCTNTKCNGKVCDLAVLDIEKRIL
uniref:Uncharacterized protein n=1 Tax=Amphimedon queenslandica TaxID=400682 RepID=A0A1X7V1J4_AMPQE